MQAIHPSGHYGNNRFRQQYQQLIGMESNQQRIGEQLFVPEDNRIQEVVANCDKLYCYKACRLLLIGGGRCTKAGCLCYHAIFDVHGAPLNRYYTEDNIWYELEESEQKEIIDTMRSRKPKRLPTTGSPHYGEGGGRPSFTDTWYGQETENQRPVQSTTKGDSDGNWWDQDTDRPTDGNWWESERTNRPTLATRGPETEGTYRPTRRPVTEKTFRTRRPRTTITTTGSAEDGNWWGSDDEESSGEDLEEEDPFGSDDDWF